MAASIIKESVVIVDGYDLSCAFKELGIQKQCGEVDSTAICTTGDRSWLPGLKQGTLNLNGIYDFDDTDEDEIENVLATAFEDQAELIVSSSFNAITIGGEAWMTRGGQSSKDVQTPLEQLIMTNAVIRANGNAFRGTWLFNATIDNTTLVGTAVDNGAATSDGGILHFHSHTPDGAVTDSLIVVEHSVDNAVWANLILGTALGAGSGAVAVVVASGTTVRRYLRAIVQNVGGEATAVAAFHRF